MPDMHLDDDGRVILDEPTDLEQRAQAIANCGLCDDEGYRGHVICDHRIHSTRSAREAAKDQLRRALSKDGEQ